MSPLRGKELQAGIVDRARTLGWRVAHFPPIRTTRGGKSWWLTPVAADGRGFPDLLLVRERLLVAEVKGTGDSLRPDQREWHTAFRLAGVEVYVWTPRDWPEVIVEVLRRRLATAPLTWEAPDASVQ